MNKILILNILLCLTILVLSIIHTKRSGEKLALFIGLAFALFGVSHVINIMGKSDNHTIIMTGLRLSAYSLIIFSLFNLLKKSIVSKEQMIKKEKFQLLFSSSIDSVLLSRLTDGLIIDTNEGFAALTGYPIQYIIGKTAKELNLWKDFSLRDEWIKEILKNGECKNFECEFIKKNGEFFTVLISGRIIEINNEKHILSIARDITRQKQIEREKDQSNKKIKMILESAGEGIFGIDTNGLHTFVNPLALKLLGYEIDELIGKQSHKIWHHSYPDGSPYECPDCPIYRTLKEGKTNHGEEYFIKKGGVGFYVEYTSMPLYDDDIIIGAVVTFLDISDRKTSEKLIKDSELHFRTLFEKANDGIIYLNTVGQIVRMNESFAKMHGYTVEEMNQIKLQDMDVEDISELAPSRFKRVLDGEELRFEVKHFRKDRNIIDIEVIISLLTLNNEIYFVAFHRDITERKKVEKELIEREEQLRTLIEQASDGIFISDRNGNYIDVNLSGCEMLGYKKEEILKLNIIDVIHSDDLIDNPMKYEQMNEGVTVLAESKLKCKDGSILNVEVSGKKLSDGRMQGLVRDITQRKQIEKEQSILLEHLRESNETIEANLYQKNSLIEELTEAKEQLEKINKEKDKFFSIIAHDLRSPFSGFLGLTKILSEDINDLTLNEMKEIANSMQTSAKSLYKLLENLLDWATIQRGVMEFNPQNINISDMINQNISVQTEISKQKEISIINIIPHGTSVNADRQMINTVLRNFISNALKFTPRLGKIEIGIFMLSEEPEQSDIYKNTCIYIKDTGIGMNQDTISKLFKIDQKVSKPGTEGEPSTGLGLLLCKEFVEKNGGRIWVESAEGKGSTFYFSLPKYNS